MKIQIELRGDGITLIITAPHVLLKYSGLTEDEADALVDFFETQWEQKGQVPLGAV